MSFMPLVTGNPAPWFTARSSNNPEFRLESAAGRPLLLVFIGSAATSAGQKILSSIEPYRAQLNDQDLALFFVSHDPEDELQRRLVQQLPGIRIFWDFDRRLAGLYGASNAAHGCAYLLNPRL